MCLLCTFISLSDSPPHSLKDSNVSSKVKTMEEGVGIRPLHRNTMGVEGHVKTLKLGLG